MTNWVIGTEQVVPWARFKIALSRTGAKGWTVQPGIEGRPDIAFLDEKVAIFLDGCFWHGCFEHYRQPKINRKMWAKKIRENQKRDAQVTEKMALAGWKVFRVWEHDIADPETSKGIALRVARAVDTPDSEEPYKLISNGGVQ